MVLYGWWICFVQLLRGDEVGVLGSVWKKSKSYFLCELVLQTGVILDVRSDKCGRLTLIDKIAPVCFYIACCEYD